MATPSSANLAAALTDESGSNTVAFTTSPTFVTPTLGVASATTVNKVTFTAPATGSTLTIADGKTLTASNTLTLTGTDASSVAFGAGGTVAYTANKLSAFAATTSSELLGVISDETGSGALVFGTSPAITTSLTTPSTTFALVNTTATTVNFAGAATAINIGASSAVTTVNGKLTVAGAYANTHLTTYGSMFIDGTSTNNIVQASSNTRLQGIGLWSTGGTGRVYNSGGDFEILVGTTLRDQDTPTGGTTALTINGTTGAVQLASDLAVNGGDITTSATTFNLLNATATTLNIGGAATTLSIGAATGTTTVNNALTVSGNLTVSGTTTTVNTETINLADNVITLNSNEAGTPSQNAGIEVERGTSTNVAFQWNETTDVWEYTVDGTNYIPVVGTTASQTLTNKTISGASNTLSNIGNGSLTNSAITLGGTSVSLGGAFTATNMLDAIKTVDGAGSGLDADLLDGNSSAFFRINIYDSAGTLLN